MGNSMNKLFLRNRRQNSARCEVKHSVILKKKRFKNVLEKSEQELKIKKI